MASYCTVAQARAAGAAGTDAEVTAAITDASERVDRYTRTIFDRRTLTVEAPVQSNGRARLPLPALTVTSVTYEASPGASLTLLPDTYYRLDRASTPGDTDALQLGGGSLGLDTVVGQSSRSLISGLTAGAGQGLRVRVTGDFGRESVPVPVARATALVAAAITGGSSGSVVNAEGDASLPPTVGQLEDTGTGTGLAAADSLLRPYLRQRVRLG